MRNAVGMTPLTVILAVLVGGALYGPLGSILAIPIGAAAQVFIQDLLRARADDPDSILRESSVVESSENRSTSHSPPVRRNVVTQEEAK